MTDLDFLKKLKQAEKELGFKNKQFSGATTVHLIKELLSELNLQTSEKDVFIQNIPIEIDFLVVKPNSKPNFGCLWNSEDVLACFEIKKSGLIDDDGKIKVNSDFSRIQSRYSNIKLFYVTVSETRTKVATIQKSNDSFTFFIRRNGKYSSTGDFERFLEAMKSL